MTRNPGALLALESGQLAALYVYLAHQIPLLCAECHFKWYAYLHRIFIACCAPTSSYQSVLLPLYMVGAFFDAPSCRRAQGRAPIWN